jgi:hypothetical protein
MLRDAGIRVDTHFVGYDLEAYFQGTAITEEDVGSIQVAVGTVLAKIEIKATRGATVSMSYAQGEAATSDRWRYWLCVVHLPLAEPVSNLDQSRVEALAQFVPTIGDWLSPSHDGIEDALREAASRGFELRYVEDIRYEIGQAIWEKYGVGLGEFIAALVSDVVAPTQ